MTRQMSPPEAFFGPGAPVEGPFGYDNPDCALRAFDPQLYLANLAVALAPVEGAAKAAIMAWILELPDDIDPACAAARLLDLPLFSGVGPEAGEATELIDLLRQVSLYPRDRLGRVRRGRRRQLHA